MSLKIEISKKIKVIMMDIEKTVENSEEISLFPAIILITKGHTNFFNAKLEGTGVTSSELPLLLNIYGDDGEISQKEISNLLNISEPVVARTIKNLEQKGFVTRKPDITNRRRNKLSLTESGIEICKEMIDINEEWENEIFKNVSPDEKELFDKVLKSVLKESLNL